MKNLITPTGLHIGGRWLAPGDPVPGTVPGFNYEKAARKGLLEDTEGAEIVNVQAVGNPVPTVAADSGLPALLALLEVDSFGEFESQLETLRMAANRAETLAGQVTTLEGQLSAAQAELATLRTLQAAEGGTPLPSNFTGRGKLVAFGLDTYESLRGKTAAQLDAIEGLTLDKAADIVAKVETHFKPAE